MRLAGYRIRWSWVIAAAPIGPFLMIGGELKRTGGLHEPAWIAFLVVPCALWWVVGIARLALERPDGALPPKSVPSKGQFY